MATQKRKIGLGKEKIANNASEITKYADFLIGGNASTTGMKNPFIMSITRFPRFCDSLRQRFLDYLQRLGAIGCILVRSALLESRMQPLCGGKEFL